jgi:hypothetical protein
MAMATDRAIAQAFREACDAADADHATLRDMQRWVNHRAAELDATPPAGAGEAVAWMLRWTGVFTEEGKSHFYTDKKAADRMAETVRDSYGCPDVEVTPLYAAPTPLPEAVREIADEIARWEEVGPIASDDTVSVPAATLHQWAAALRAIPAQAQRKENDDV